MSTTTLSQRLRDLRNGLFPDIETVNAVLDKAIAQAEAQEAQAVELSQEQVDRACEVYADNHPHNGPISVNRTAMRRALASVQPSQAIGEQTPVAWMSEESGHIVKAKELKNMGGNWKAVYHIPLYHSPISPEARDRAIDALDKVQILLNMNANSNEFYDRRAKVRPLVNDALSALRGE